MNIYAVVIWSGAGTTPDALDMIFLVRAGSLEAAVKEVERDTIHYDRKYGVPDAVFLVGTDASCLPIDDSEATILFTPLVTRAYCYGWKNWRRNWDDEGNYTNTWTLQEL